MAKSVQDNGTSYHKYDVTLTREISTRSGNVYNKDEDFINTIFEFVREKEAEDSRTFIIKRSGVGSLVASQIANDTRGMLFWEDQTKLYYAAAGNIYIYNTVTNILVTLSSVFSTTTGEVGFTEYLFDTNVTTILATDGTTLIQIAADNSFTVCADADLPVPHIPCPVFIDGYLLLVKSGTADIYNSDLNDPFAWTPGNFISAEMSPDLLVKLGKVNNYLIAFGTESAEYFWDAGNATGSPFSRNDSPIKINAYLGGLCLYGNSVYYIGKNVSGQPSVFSLKDFSIDELASESVVRYLNFVTTDPSTWRTSVLACQGHTLLLVNAGSRSYVYDMETKLWGRFSYQQTDIMPVSYSVRAKSSTNRNSVFCMSGYNSEIFYLDDGLMQDKGINYTVQVITEQSNFGTLDRKTMPRFAFYADRTPANSNIQIYWTDDDFQSWEGPRDINMNQDLQSTYNLGSFRQRAFKLLYTDQYILRLQKIEVNVNKGIS